MTRSNNEVSGTGPASSHRYRKRVEVLNAALGEHGNGFLESFDIIRCHDHRRGPAVHGHGHPLMPAAHAAHDLKQVGLDLGKRHRRHSHEYDE